MSKEVEEKDKKKEDSNKKKIKEKEKLNKKEIKNKEEDVNSQKIKEKEEHQEALTEIKNSKDKNSSKKEKSKKKKTIKITIAIILIILIVGIGIFFGYKSYQANQSVGSNWGDIYYDFIQESITQDSKEAKIKNNSKIEFLEVSDIDEPVMIVNYEKKDEDYSDIYFINEEKVKSISLDSSEIEMLYSLSNKKYNWYIHTKSEEEDKYKLLSSQINKELEKKTSKEEKNTEFIYKFDEEIFTEKVDGTKITMSKFDSEFVKVDVKVNEISYNKDLTEKELKESLKTGVKEYKTNKELTTKEVKEKVIKKEQEIKKTKEEMKKAEEEVAKKKEEEEKKAEEERKRAEEEAKKAKEEAMKGLKVGNYTLKYGKYTSDVHIQDSSMYGTLIIRPNGQFHIKANCEGYEYPYKVLDNDGTYKVTKIQNSFSYFDGLEFRTNNGVVFGLEVHEYNGSVRLSDQWHGYDYVGNE